MDELKIWNISINSLYNLLWAEIIVHVYAYNPVENMLAVHESVEYRLLVVTLGSITLLVHELSVLLHLPNNDTKQISTAWFME